MKEKKIRLKIPKEGKIRAELQQEIDSHCPFCNSKEVGHFEIHHIDENPSNNNSKNLLLLCPICHSKITKGDILFDEVTQLKKSLLLNLPAKKENEPIKVNFNKSVENAIIGNNNNVTIVKKKPVVEKYPIGCIGFDTIKANYISHLIGRYNEYKVFELGKGNVQYAVFISHLKKRYKIGPTRTIYNLSIDKFEELVSYIQARIDGTQLARSKGKWHKNYSSFEEYTNS